MQKSKLPAKLYKYCSFNAKTLHILSREEVYFANPVSFNDPLDCKPTIKVDVDRSSLERLFVKMLADESGKTEALRRLQECRYLSSEFGDYRTNIEAGEFYDRTLASAILDGFTRLMSKFGVLALAKRWNCPLMWSHYANQHEGICIEYSTRNPTPVEINAVSYNKPRAIKVSDLIDWKFNASVIAENAIRDTFFFSKANPWKYEQEWRAINKKAGLDFSPFTISGVYFGLRCSSAVQTALVKLFDNDHRQIKFYGVYESDDDFSLKRYEVNTDEIRACGVSSSYLRDFEGLSSLSS
ncbi:DUF2971 domain-containing protein [Prosthecobacter fluviatilis]|uniref:DUF2971 domain-containing protein n=1 Tax=Prosthecobacter fluviatilis TaxID=445931 RepID=A0ABW0KS21_9BACT